MTASRLFVLLYLFIAVPGWSAPQAPPPKLPADVFATLPVLTEPILSPDGKAIAARSVSDGYLRIALIDADHPDAAARMLDVGKFQVAALRWAGNARLLLTIRSRATLLSGYEVPFLKLLVIDVPSGVSRLVDKDSHGGFAGDVLYADPNGAWALVASQNTFYNYPSVKRVDLATGKAEIVEKARDGVWDWYADDKGVVRAGVAKSDRRWTVWYRENAGDKLRPIRGKIETKKDSVIDRFVFRGPKSWVVTNEPTGRFALYEYDVESASLGKAIFEHPVADIDDVYFDAATGEVKAVEYEDDRIRYKWFDPDMAALQATIDRALPATVNLVRDLSSDDNRVLILSEGASDPGRYFLLDRKSKRMHAVVAPYPRVDPATLSETEWFAYKARDGLQLYGYLTLPADRAPANLPLVLMPHGGPFVRDHWEYDPTVQFLANRGYAVFQPQFRGSVGRGKDFVERGYGEWGRKMQDDLDDAVAQLAASGKIDRRRVCIVGSSYGGYAALWAAVRNPDIYRCAASYAGVSNLASMLAQNRQFFTAKRYYNEWRTVVTGAESTDLRGFSPITYADRIKIPILIGHGELDETVPVAQSSNMLEALRQAGHSPMSVFYPKGGHSWENAEDFTDWLKRLDQFLYENNAP